MKKVLSVLLALILCLSLCACASNAKSEKVYEVGEMVSTDAAQVILNSYSFEDSYNSIKLGQNGFDEGYFVILKFSIKNTGKTNLQNPVLPDRWSNGYFAEMVCMEYNDGYLFYCEPISNGIQNWSIENFYSPYNINISDIKPLSDAIDVETAIYVPKEVVDKTAAPLFAKIAVPDSKGGHYGTEIFTYKIR